MEQKNWVGVDCHKETLACYQNGKFKEFKVTSSGFKKALEWAGNSKWAIEGAYCFGKPFTAYLIQNGHEVYEVNSLLTKTWRRGLSINGQKNDFGDAKIISMIAPSFKLQKVSLETIQLKEKLTARELLVKQRTKIINSIKNLYAMRGETLYYKKLTTQKSQIWLSNQDDIIIKNFGNILKELNNSIKEFEKEIERLLPPKAKKLTELKGIKTLMAAIIYTELKGKIESKGQLANYAGVAPIENSSGKSSRHKNNKSGNRKLNSVFYKVSLNQSKNDPLGKEYYEKKIKEGKTPRHARKCLARQLVNIVWKILKD